MIDKGIYRLQHRHDSELGRLQLMIDNLSPDDASTFVCRASNVAGDSEATATVVVNCTFSLLLFEPSVKPGFHYPS